MDKTDFSQNVGATATHQCEPGLIDIIETRVLGLCCSDKTTTDILIQTKKFLIPRRL